MAAEVVVTRSASGAPIQSDTFENGRMAYVSDGHLFVSSDFSRDGHRVLAVYAPGDWKSVNVTPTAAS